MTDDDGRRMVQVVARVCQHVDGGWWVVVEVDGQPYDAFRHGSRDEAERAARDLRAMLASTGALTLRGSS